LRLRGNECLDIRVPMPPGRVGSDGCEIPVSALPVRPGDNGRRDRGERPRGFPAALLRERATEGRRRGVASEVTGAGPLPACCTAVADRRVEDQARGESGGP
jgi:hypothetical protein